MAWPSSDQANETDAGVGLLRRRASAGRGLDPAQASPRPENPRGKRDGSDEAATTKRSPARLDRYGLRRDLHAGQTIIFAFRGYPWLIHRIPYRGTSHANIYVRGYKENGTISVPFNMAVLNDLDRFHRVIDVIDRVQQIGEKGSTEVATRGQADRA